MGSDGCLSSSAANIFSDIFFITRMGSDVFYLSHGGWSNPTSFSLPAWGVTKAGVYQDEDEENDIFFITRMGSDRRESCPAPPKLYDIFFITRMGSDPLP